MTRAPSISRGAFTCCFARVARGVTGPGSGRLSVPAGEVADHARENGDALSCDWRSVIGVWTHCQLGVWQRPVQGHRQVEGQSFVTISYEDQRGCLDAVEIVVCEALVVEPHARRLL